MTAEARDPHRRRPGPFQTYRPPATAAEVRFSCRWPPPITSRLAADAPASNASSCSATTFCAESGLVLDGDCPRATSLLAGQLKAPPRMRRRPYSESVDAAFTAAAGVRSRTAERSTGDALQLRWRSRSSEHAETYEGGNSPATPSFRRQRIAASRHLARARLAMERPEGRKACWRPTSAKPGAGQPARAVERAPRETWIALALARPARPAALLLVWQDTRSCPGDGAPRPAGRGARRRTPPMSQSACARSAHSPRQLDPRGRARRALPCWPAGLTLARIDLLATTTSNRSPRPALTAPDAVVVAQS